MERLPAADKAKYSTYLQKFETKRNHYRPDAKQLLENATLYMKEKFESAGLEVKLQNFTTSDTTTGQVCAVIQLFRERLSEKSTRGKLERYCG